MGSLPIGEAWRKNSTWRKDSDYDVGQDIWRPKNENESYFSKTGRKEQRHPGQMRTFSFLLFHCLIFFLGNTYELLLND